MEDPAYLKAAYAEQRADDPGTQAYMLLVDLASGLITAGMKPSKVGKPARAVTRD